MQQDLTPTENINKPFDKPYAFFNLMGVKHMAFKPTDYDKYREILELSKIGHDIGSGLVSKEELEKLWQDDDFKNRLRATHFANYLSEVSSEEDRRHIRAASAISESVLAHQRASEDLASKNFNMHFYRIMTSLMLFGVIDVLDIFGSALDLMGGDFSDSLKEVVGSQEVMGDLSKLYTALKIDEMVGLVGSIPILEDLNQFFVDALSSDYLSPITSVGDNFLSSQFAVLALGAVLIANRGYQEYSIYDEAVKLNEKEEKDLKQLKENIKISIKNFQKDPTLIFHKKNKVDMENHRSDIYWDKVRSDNQFCETFLTKAQNFVEKNLSNVDSNIDKLTDIEKQDHQELKKSFEKFKEQVLEGASFSSTEKIDKFEEYLKLPQNKKILFYISKFIQDDFNSHKDLKSKFEEKRIEHYVEKFSHESLKTSEFSTIQNSNDKINKAIKDIIDESNASNATFEKKLTDDQVKLLQDFSKKTLNEKQDFIKNSLNDSNIQVFDKVRIKLEGDKILENIRFNLSPIPSSSPSKPEASRPFVDTCRSSGGEVKAP